VAADRAFHLEALETVARSAGAPTVVLGHSLGGVLGLLWAADRTDGIAGLAMVASPFPQTHPEWDPERWQGSRGALPRAIVATVRAGWPVLSLPVQVWGRYPAPVVRDYGRQSIRSRLWTLWSLSGEPSLQNEVGRAAQHFLQPRRRIGIEKVDARELDAGDRFHVEHVNGDHAAAFANALRRHLAPAAGRGAQIDHARAWPQQMVLVVDLGELEGGAAAIASALRLLDIRIVELTLEPASRGDLPPLGGLDPHRQLAAAVNRMFQVQLVQPAHQGEVLRALRHGLVIKPAARNTHQLALPLAAQFRA